MSCFRTWLEAIRAPRDGKPTAQQHALDEVQDQFVTMSKADGRPGLDNEDLTRAVRQVRWLDEHIKETSVFKASAMADWLVMEAKGRISPWTAKTLGYIAFRYAKKLGIIP